MTYYEEIAKYYDLLMEAGYYDHESLAKAVQSSVGEGKRILELGIGTGRLAEELINLDPTCELTGIDFSPAMVEIARNRLPDDVPVIECDVASMDLGRTFDAAVSSGGTWVIIDKDEELQLGTHLFDRNKDIAGLCNVSEHLEENAKLLLSIHPPHEDREILLKDDIVYSQKIEDKKETTDHFCLEKKYSFKRNGKTLAEETLTLGFYKAPLYEEILSGAGFEAQEMSEGKEFLIFEKTS